MHRKFKEFLVIPAAIPAFFLHNCPELFELVREGILRIACIEFQPLIFCQSYDLRSEFPRKLAHLAQNHIPGILVDGGPARLSLEKGHQIHKSCILDILAERSHKRRITQSRPYIFHLLEKHHHKLVQSEFRFALSP